LRLEVAVGEGADTVLLCSMADISVSIQFGT